MGGTVSAGSDNDDLINNLVEANYIRTPLVEKVFRTVDRAFYFLPEFRYSAYRDLAWKHGNLHLSAPCIYSEVLEHLSLESGRSFLNIGSGTGYLSTMAGLMLGPYGVNHGIEIQSDVVDYAYDRLEQFKKTCNGLDIFEFCEPYFVVGNGFDLGHERQYDRIYCGAACPQTHHEHIKKHLKVNGILIVPCDEDLLKIVRTSESDWEVTSVLSVSFSTLQSPDKLSKTISIPDPQPLALQELCRSKIRCVLREAVESENPVLMEKPKRKRASRDPNRHMRNRVVLRENDGFIRSNNRNGHFDLSNVIFHTYSSTSFRDFMINLRRGSADAHDDLDASEEDQIIANDSESASSESEYSPDVNLPQININENGTSRPSSNISESLVSRMIRNDAEVGVVEFVSSDEDDGEDDPESEVDLEEISAEFLRYHSRRKLPARDSCSSEATNDDADTEERQPHSSCEPNQNIRKKVGEESNKQPKKILKREKLDSGISEESDDGKVSRSYESSFSESTFSEPMELESDDSDSNRSHEDQSDDNTIKDGTNEMQPNIESLSFKYRTLMEQKIQDLPLPQRVKIYLNHDREFQAEKC